MLLVIKGMLAIDIVSRKAASNIEIYGENLNISWDGTPHGLYDFNIEIKENNLVNLYTNIDKLEKYSANIVENAYKCEIEIIFKTIINNETFHYTFKEDVKILRVIDKVEI